MRVGWRGNFDKYGRVQMAKISVHPETEGEEALLKLCIARGRWDIHGVEVKPLYGIDFNVVLHYPYTADFAFAPELIKPEDYKED